MHFDFLVEDQSGVKAMNILLPKVLDSNATYRIIKPYKGAGRLPIGLQHEYKNDSICGTWELLADAVCKGGSKNLVKKGWQAIGKQKSIWAEEISPHMNVDSNISPSFKNMIILLRSVALKDVHSK